MLVQCQSRGWLCSASAVVVWTVCVIGVQCKYGSNGRVCFRCGFQEKESRVYQAPAWAQPNASLRGRDFLCADIGGARLRLSGLVCVWKDYVDQGRA